MMERLLAENAVSSEMLTELTGRLAAFHGSSESSKHISTFGSRETVGGNWQENFDQTD
jgi:aminoglycoside phosphotransferase family enzyme